MCVSRARASGAGVTEPEVLAAGTINADSLVSRALEAVARRVRAAIYPRDA